MSKTFAVDENNDLYIGADGNLAIVTGLESVLQICAQTCKTILGEMVLNQDLGLPDFQLIWNGVPNVMQYESAVRVAILQVPDVLEVTSFRAILADNILSYSATIRTSFGEGAISG